ncbi:MAG TPA: hypothetical protein VFI70_12040 [Nitrososphaeraceae archaeon]|nr:hypothetical protein [Nitrososphaeraceae archaeon]
MGQCSGIAPNSRKVEGAQQVADQVESFGYDPVAIAVDLSKEIDSIRLRIGALAYSFMSFKTHCACFSFSGFSFVKTIQRHGCSF